MQELVVEHFAPSPRILIVDDDPYIRGLLRKAFEGFGYQVDVAENGESALDIFTETMPDLVLLDVMMPRLNGLSTCREIRKRSRSRRVPILMLTALNEVQQKVDGFEEGADDYITKPFNLAELKARVKANIRRAQEEQAKNPLTGLPGNISIRNQINELLAKNARWAILYADLDNFKAYNDIYGFASGDEVIEMTAELLDEAVKKEGNSLDFLGHIGGDDFIIVTTPERMDSICDHIFDHFDQRIRKHYREEDIEKGYLITIDRTGSERKFPLITLSIGGVTNRTRDYSSYVEISTVAAEMKKYAKELDQRKFAIDRRKQ